VAVTDGVGNTAHSSGSPAFGIFVCQVLITQAKTFYANICFRLKVLENFQEK